MRHARWWPRTSADCRRRSLTGCPGCSSTATIPRFGRECWAICCGRPGGCDQLAVAARGAGRAAFPGSERRPGCSPRTTTRSRSLRRAHACCSTRHVTDTAELIESALREKLRRVRGSRRRASSSSTCLATRRLKTACWLTVGDHALTIEAFVVRNAGRERRAGPPVPARTQRPHVRGRVVDRRQRRHLPDRPPAAVRVTADEIDRILGAVLEYADGSFNPLLQLGFGSSIRREWAGGSRTASRWRTWPRSPTSPSADRLTHSSRRNSKRLRIGNGCAVTSIDT